jgi:branched-chain amino acid transport system ATP-binding protein
MNNSIVKDNEPFLQIQGLTKFFGGLAAVNDLNMFVKRDEILALIGPNGAGKTTVFNLISGFLRPQRGRVTYKNEDITNLQPYQKVKKGIVRSFQSNILFMEKTVRENVLLGFFRHYKASLIEEILNMKSSKLDNIEIENKADSLLEFMSLTKLKDIAAKNLTHGHQRMLGVSVALAAKPELLLLDEPVTGMNDEETALMMGIIKKIQKRGISILLVEHDMKAVMKNCERIVVMDHGRKIAEGSPSEIINNEQVIEAYLGIGEFNA